MGHVASEEGTANSGGRDRLERERHLLESIDADNVETALTAEVLEEREVPAALVPEVQVIADHQCLCSDPAQQDLLGEIQGSTACLDLVELDQECMVDPASANEVQPVIEARKERRCALGPQNHRRVPDKGDHGRFDSTLTCLANRSGKDLLMAKVDAVEGAQRRHGAQVDQLTVTPTMYLHDNTRYWRNDRQAYAGIVTR